MPRFWSLISNGEYSVGCTGQSVYVYDKDGAELIRFRGLLYAYRPLISPKGDIFVVKTTEGRLYVYSLITLSLIKKFRFSKVNYAQDDNCCFSPDGKYFYNIERYVNDLRSCLSIYKTEDFSLEKRLFSEDEKMVLDIIEYNSDTDIYYILGYCRPDDYEVGCNEYFISQFMDDTLKNTVYITEAEHEYYLSYKNMEAMGFSEKSKKWALNLKWYGYNTKGIEKRNHSLAKLWEYYISNQK